MTALLVATLLTVDIHAGGSAGVGVGVPFRSANAGPVIVLKGHADIPIGNKLTVGAVLPITFGFYNTNIGFGSINWFILDLLPGFRATYEILDWVRAVVELGAGPAIYNASTNVLGTSSGSTRTYFAMRASALAEVAPVSSMKNLFFWAEPFGLYARLDNSWSEYRFSLGAGYRL